MFSPTATFNNRLVDYSFIAGINQEEIDYNDFNKTYIPTCLLGYPENNQDEFSQVAELVYPLDVCVLPEKTNEDIISFYTTILTNERGLRSYIYVLKMYDDINHIRTPIAICFCSTVNDTDSFKQLLNEIYMILSSDYSVLTKNIELMNYFMFVHSILIPPTHTSLTLNMRYMTVNFYFNSLCEIPNSFNNTSINILFSVLDVSKIIKLWLNVLREKKIIIYGNKPYLLNAIGDAITKLIFPFKWQHTYMSCLPKSQIDFLDAPCPYIFGVLSSLIDIKTLCKNCPNACIVDLETGQIFSKKVTRLPREEEIALRKKIQYIKNPELFEENELFKEEKKDFLNKENIDLSQSFSSNIQTIFFQILKKTLKNYKDYIIKDKFEDKRFLTTIKSPELRGLWGKIIKTNMFDHFIQKSHYKDELFNQVFDNLSMEDKERNPKNDLNALKVEITMPPINSASILNLLEEMKTETDGEFENILLQYSKETTRSRFPKAMRKTSTKSLAPFQNFAYVRYNNSIKREESKEILNQEEIDAMLFSDSESGDSSSDYISNKKGVNDFFLQKNQSIASSKGFPKNEFKQSVNEQISTNSLICVKQAFINTIVKTSTISAFNFTSDNGFIAFMKRMIELSSNDKYQLIDIFFKRQFLKEILEASGNISESTSIKNEMMIIEGDSINDNSYMKSPKQAKITHPFKKQMKYQSTLESISAVKFKEDCCSILKLSNVHSNLNQQYLFYAFYLEEIADYPEGVFISNTDEISNRIVHLYHHALIEDSIDFPYYRYSTVIKFIPNETLKTYENDKRLTPLRSLLQETKNNIFKNFRGSTIKKVRTIYEGKYALPPDDKTNQEVKADQIVNISQFNILPRSTLSFVIKAVAKVSNELNIDYSKIAKQMKKERRNKMKDIRSKEEDEENEFKVEKDNDETSTVIEPITIKESLNSLTFCSLNKPLIINKHKKVYKSFEPLDLILKLADRMIELIDKHKHKELQASNNNQDFNAVIELVSYLQRINLAKLTKTSDQYTFWLNSFNFLLIYGCLYTGFYPRTFEDWNLLMTNCLYNIGGYEISLYEIENKILNCHNLHQSTINYTDSLTGRFSINDYNILTDFALFFPIKSHIFNLIKFTSNQFEEQLYQTAKTFLNNNLRYKSKDNTIVMSKYIELICPNFVTENYKYYQHYLNDELFSVLDGKSFTSTSIEDICWTYSL